MANITKDIEPGLCEGGCRSGGRGITTSLRPPPYNEQRQADGSIKMHIRLPQFKQHFGRAWKGWLRTFKTLWRDDVIVTGADDEGVE